MAEWTEQDEERFNKSERERKMALIEKIRKDAQKRYDMNEDNYQNTGSLSAYRAMDKWKDLLTLCSMAEEGLQKQFGCRRCEQRYRNAKLLADRVKSDAEAGQKTIPADVAINYILTAGS